ncbi:glycosyltransferase [Phenylobacterium sp.]|uniref:glycosyltransferase n=1 Tax=Phenylobacterium sp. TaxID=1871053 RepID=UPI0035AF7215
MSRPAPVALFCAGLNGDGVARNTVHLANALSRRGAAVEIVSLEAGALADQIAPEVELALLGRPKGSRGRALAAAVPALRRRLAAAPPSVLVSMGNHAHLAAWAALRALPGVPRLYRISNDPAGCGRSAALRTLRRATQALIAADATAVITVSAALAEAPPFRRVRSEGRLHVLPNGVDAEAVRRRAREPLDHPWLADGRPFVAAVGRLHPQKNYGALLEGLTLARQARPDLRLLVLGRATGPEATRIAARADALGLADAVRLEGEVANPYPFLARAAAYALPSRWEGASNSLLEALACGAPTLASRTAGNAAEVLGEGRYGVLMDPDRPDDVARAILRQAGEDRILPGDRAEAFALDRVMDRACGVVLAARREHDGIQTFREARGHGGSLGCRLRGTSTEY